MKFGDEISEKLHRYVFSLAQYLIENPIEEIVNISPGYNSVLIRLNNKYKIADTTEMLTAAVKRIHPSSDTQRQIVGIPVCYHDEYGVDLDRVMNHTQCSKTEIVDRHINGKYLVYFIGFSAGFPYIGGMDETLATPRLESPRKVVPSGSVGIAGRQTGIYPLSTPGGWNLIGRTPLSLIDKNHPENSLIKMGDEVQFYSIDLDEFDKLNQHP